jgi:hypothetical protein
MNQPSPDPEYLLTSPTAYAARMRTGRCSSRCAAAVNATIRLAWCFQLLPRQSDNLHELQPLATSADLLLPADWVGGKETGLGEKRRGVDCETRTAFSLRAPAASLGKAYPCIPLNSIGALLSR